MAVNLSNLSNIQNTLNSAESSAVSDAASGNQAGLIQDQQAQLSADSALNAASTAISNEATIDNKIIDNSKFNG
jgi:hypothetical protein